MDKIHLETCSKVKGSQIPNEMYAERWYPARVDLWYHPFVRSTLHLAIKSAITDTNITLYHWKFKQI